MSELNYIAELERNNKQLQHSYEKQKEINKELVDDIAALNKTIRELKKSEVYYSDNLDAEVEKKLERQKEIHELRKRVAEQDAEIERLARGEK